MLGKIEGGRRRGRQRMRWLDGITDSMDVSLSKLLITQCPSVALCGVSCLLSIRNLFPFFFFLSLSSASSAAAPEWPSHKRTQNKCPDHKKRQVCLLPQRSFLSFLYWSIVDLQYDVCFVTKPNLSPPSRTVKPIYCHRIEVKESAMFIAGTKQGVKAAGA